ncbi:MAG: hypothetical protein Q9196_006958, partial [Gyalolechia fulgens]
MPSSRPSTQLSSRKRKIYHVLDSSEEEGEEEALVLSKRHRKRRLRPRYSRARQVPIDHAILTPVTIALSPSPQAQILGTLPTDPAVEHAVTDGKSASLQIPSPGYLPESEGGVASMTHQEPSQAEYAESPPQTPFEFVYQDLVDDDFGRKVCEAFTSSQWRQGWREYRYGESVANEWKRGSTPEEAREAWRAKLEEQDRSWE